MGGYAHRGWKEAHGAPPAALRARGGDALTTPRTYRSLLAGAIDYAGLFPPASLGIPDAVAEYAAHRSAADRWALGRFVVPLSRWDELAAIVAPVLDGARWPVSVLAATDDVDQMAAVMNDASLEIQSVECKVASVAEASDTVRLATLGPDVFVESADPAMFEVIAPILAHAGAAGKIRTGGITSGAIPSPRDVLAFLQLCRKVGIRFKATAGLHHAVRGEYRLTYEPIPPTGVMFGFLNVSLAAALVWHGRSASTVLQVLEEPSIEAFEFGDDGISWRNETLSRSEVEEARAHFFTGFGSCSFREPMAEIGLQVGPA